MSVTLIFFSSLHVVYTKVKFTPFSTHFKVLSESVGKVLEVYGKPEDQELAKFILLMDKFFDIMNVRSKGEAGRKLKEFCLPISSKDDGRFKVIMIIK